MFRAICLLTLLAAGTLPTGCAPIRASSRSTLSAQSSTLVIDATRKDVLARIKELLGRRGLNLVGKHSANDGSTIYRFKGNRDTVTVVSGTDGYVSSSSDAVGSVIYVRIQQTAEGRVTVDFLGKPVVSGKEVCSEADWLPEQCSEVVVGIMWPGRSITTGKEEAEIVQGVMLELDES